MSSAKEYKTPEHKRLRSKERSRKRRETPEGLEAVRAYNKAYAKANRDKLNELNRELYSKSRTKIQLQRKKIEPTEELIRAIDTHHGICDICKGPPDGRWHTLSIDHCHDTNSPRGMLCTKCNKGLGYFQDDPELLAAAIKYLSSPPLSKHTGSAILT
jgi:antitoxin component HigA of HigAB toxin-antitoxin module